MIPLVRAYFGSLPFVLRTNADREVSISDTRIRSQVILLPNDAFLLITMRIRVTITKHWKSIELWSPVRREWLREIMSRNPNHPKCIP